MAFFHGLPGNGHGRVWRRDGAFGSSRGQASARRQGQQPCVAPVWRWGARLVLAACGLCSSFAAGAVDANAATVAELMAVRGIGPKTALLIVRERERGGAFESLADLAERVRGIGPKRVRVMQAGGLEAVVGTAVAPGAGGTTAGTPRPR